MKMLVGHAVSRRRAAKDTNVLVTNRICLFVGGRSVLQHDVVYLSKLRKCS